MSCLERTFLGLAVLSSASCIGFHGPNGIRRELVETTGARLEQQSGLSVGRMGLALARCFTKDEEVPLAGVHHVEVGVYSVEEGHAVELSDPPRLAGWETVVEMHEEDGDTFVLVQQDESRIRGMLVIVAEEDEWVLVRLRGRLDHLLEDAMRLGFDQGEREHLAEPAIAEYRASHRESTGERSSN